MLCISNPHHNTIGLSPCLAASERVKVSESHRVLYSQEGRADDPVQALPQPFLAHCCSAGSASRETVFSPKLEDAGREHLKADAGPFLTQY